MDESYAYEQPSNGVTEQVEQDDIVDQQEQHQDDVYTNGAATNGSANGLSGLNGGASPQPAVIRKTLASWVGFSNLPNQVHRRSVR